jgi:tripartite ATP-independent transporter DctP family solute receptor
MLSDKLIALWQYIFLRRTCMKKTVALCMVLLLTAGVVFAGGKQDSGAAASADAKVKWIFSATNPGDHPSIITAKAMADRITARTNGNWTFEFYPGGALAGEPDAVEMTRTGTVNWISTSSMFMETYVAPAGALGLPYLFRSWEDQRKFTEESPYMKNLWKTLEQNTNLRFVTCLNLGARDLTTKGVKRVRTPADLNGAKIRSQPPESRQNMVNSLGATAVPMSLGEVYVAIQTGVIQGQENPITTVWVSKFYEVTDDLYKTEHSYGEMAYFVNGPSFDKLPDEYKKIWDEELKIMIKETNEAMDKSEKEAEQNIKNAGVRIWEQSDLDMPAFYKSAADMINAKYMSNADWAAVVKEVNNYCGYN